jgi:hypothetical protein
VVSPAEEASSLRELVWLQATSKTSATTGKDVNFIKTAMV